MTFSVKRSAFAGQRMVGIQNHRVALDLLTTLNTCLRPSLPCPSSCPPTFTPGGNWLRGMVRIGLHRAGQSVFGGQRQRGLVARLLAFERFLDFGQRVAVATVQVNHRVFVFFNQLALGVSQFEAQGDGGVFNFHGVGFQECRQSSCPFREDDLSNDTRQVRVGVQTIARPAGKVRALSVRSVACLLHFPLTFYCHDLFRYAHD